MESDFSSQLFSEDQSLYLDDLLSEQLGFQKPAEHQSSLQNSEPMISQDPTLLNNKLFGDCDDINAILDNNDILQSLFDDFPIETPVEKNIAPIAQSVQFSLPAVSSVCKTEPTLAQLNAPIQLFESTQVNTSQSTPQLTLDDIENIVLDDLQSADLKPVVLPTAVVPENMEVITRSPVKPVVTSPYLQQLLRERVEGVDIQTDALMPDIVTYSLPSQQVSSVADDRLLASPSRSRDVVTSPSVRVASRPVYNAAQLRRPIQKQHKFSRASPIGEFCNSERFKFA